MTRESRSCPVPSVPNGWPGVGPSFVWSRKCLSGAGIGRTGAKTAQKTTRPIQNMASQPTMPSFLVADFSTVTWPSTGGMSSTSGCVPAAMSPSSTAVAELSDGSGMADPWVEDGVQDVDEEVHEHITERQDGHVALERHVLAAGDGIGDQEAHAVDHEDVLDHDRATDQGSDIESRDCQQREAGWSE